MVVSSLSQTQPRPAGAPWPLDEAAEFLGVSKRHLTRLADQKKFRVIWLGRRKLIPADEIERLAQEGC
jgi:excisionase family DNA binding protein